MVILEEVLALKLAGDQVSQKWDERFLGIACLISTWSKDPSSKIGAIAVNTERRILAQGYNGFPSGSSDLKNDYDDRTVKYRMVVHAESNIIYNACNAKIGLQKSTVYIYGMYPCPECVKGLAQVGVARLVFQLGDSTNVKVWKSQFEVSKKILHELGIGWTHYFEEYHEQINVDWCKQTECPYPRHPHLNSDHSTLGRQQ